MRIIEYIKGQKELAVCQASALIVINLILFTSTPLAKSLGEIFYMDVLIAFILGTGYFFNYRRMSKAYSKIRRAVADDQEADWILEHNDSGVYGVVIMKKLIEYKNAEFDHKEKHYKQMMNDLKEYLTQSVHDLKINLSVCEMAVKRMESETEISNKLLFQVEQMKFRINQMLSVVRANHYSEDILSESIDIEQTVKEAIAENAEFLINKGISIQNEIKPYHFISDKKWIRYIVTQIINNSSKYTNSGGEIIIYSSEDDNGYYLHIKDNGIGISKEEISRVFDKGFTGSNGRTNTKSTGMGMYYAKKMAGVLGAEISVQSEKGVYTEFVLSFYKLSDYMKNQIS